MDNEAQAIMDEITQEVKHDNMIKFVGKYQNAITASILGIIATIVMYTSWKNHVNKELHDSTRALFQAINTPNPGNQKMVFEAMVTNAPAKLQPIVKIIKAGLSITHDTKEDERKKVCADLLALSNENGLEQEWRDLALLLYANSVNNIAISKLIEMLKPLTGNDRPFRLTAKELIGVLYMTAGNKSGALQMFDQIIRDKAASDSMRERCELLRSRVS